MMQCVLQVKVEEEANTCVRFQSTAVCLCPLDDEIRYRCGDAFLH